MSSTNSRYLAVASGHIDSLISYVLDVKPYHVKLSEIVEQYLFNDNIGVKITEDDKILAFLGADILPTVGTSKVRARRSSSWFKELTSDGSRSTWQVPLVSMPKLASHSSEAGMGFNIHNSLTQEAFIKGRDDDLQIPGIENIPSNGVFNQKRWEGVGIAEVRKNGIQQQDTVDYFLSHGVFSFNTSAGQRWKELNLENISAFAENPGSLFYQDVNQAYGHIVDITGGDYDEWTLTCIDDYIELKVNTSAITVITFRPDHPKAYSNIQIILSGEQTVNGIPVVEGDIVAVAYQNINSENGFYKVKIGAWEKIVPIVLNGEQIVNGIPVVEGEIVLVNDQDIYDSTLYQQNGLYRVETGDWTNITRHNASNVYAVDGSTILTPGILPDLIENEPYIWVATGSNPGQLEVVGKRHGSIGTVLPNNAFIHTNISPAWSLAFTYSVAPGTVLISPGQLFVLTPFNKITVATDAPEEEWSVIKTNPIAIDGDGPNLTPAINRLHQPSLEIHTQCLDNATVPYTWNVTFESPTAYRIQRQGNNGSIIIPPNTLPPFDITINGYSYKDADIYFTLTPGDGFVGGDRIYFTTGANAANFIVYGSVSGWQGNATIGQWYWNGKVGFKIPALDYFPKIMNSTIVSSSSGAENEWAVKISNNQIVKSASFEGGQFYISGDNSIIAASIDGADWKTGTDIVFTPATPGQKLILIGNDGKILTSVNGIDWHASSINTTVNIHNTAFIPNFLTDASTGNLLNCIIVVGDSGTILTSISGLSWAQQTTNTLENLNDIAWNNDAIVVVGDNGTILRSLDRATWTPVVSNTTNHLMSVIYVADHSKFFAIGYNGTILTSTDGLTWLNLGAFNRGLFSDIAYGSSIANGQQFVIVSADGLMATSSDGVAWTSYQYKPFNSIAYGNGKFVAVGGSLSLTNQLVPLKPVNSCAEPSEYTITFVSETTATVVNNIYGYRPALKINTDWDDGYAAFRLDVVPGSISYTTGDIVKLYLAPRQAYDTNDINNNPNSGYDDDAYGDPYDIDSDARYDDYAYETTLYDTPQSKYTDILLYDQEYFPLYHSHGSVIFKDLVDGDKIIIDKPVNDLVRFRIKGGGAAFPELGCVDDWLPLEFRTNALFPDLVTIINAYAGWWPLKNGETEQRKRAVFTISQPRYADTNINASATLIFDPQFVADYLKFNTKFTLMFLPDQSYGQRIRVKITENLRTYARVRLNLFDIAHINILEKEIFHITVGNMEFLEHIHSHFTEGGSIPILINLYEDMGYDSNPYDNPYYSNIDLLGNITNPTPGPSILIKSNESGIKSYKINPDFNPLLLDTQQPLPNSQHPSIHQTIINPKYIPDEVDNIASSRINEGLTILERQTGTNLGGYNASPYGVVPYQTDMVYSSLRLSVIYNSIFAEERIYPSSLTDLRVNGLIIKQNADEYLVTVKDKNYGNNSPQLIVTQLTETSPGVYEDGPITNEQAILADIFTQFPLAFAKNQDSFSFRITSTITAPFRLRVV